MCVPARFSLRLKVSLSLSLSSCSLTLFRSLWRSRLISSLPSFRKWSEALVAARLLSPFPADDFVLASRPRRHSMLSASEFGNVLFDFLLRLMYLPSTREFVKVA